MALRKLLEVEKTRGRENNTTSFSGVIFLPTNIAHNTNQLEGVQDY